MSLSTIQAFDYFHSTDLIGLGMEADAIRRALHPDDVVTYAAVLASPTAEATWPTISGIVSAATAAAAKSGNFASALRETLTHLVADGCMMVADDGAQAVVATDGKAIPFERYLEVHHAAHTLGLRTAASMVFGCGETLEQCVAYLKAIEMLQQETGGLQSFTPIAYQPMSRSHLPAEWEETTAVGYLKTLSIARIALANVPMIVADCTHQPLKVVQMALRFGADDAGDLTAPIVRPHRHAAPGEQDLRRIIRDAGLRPVRRDPACRLCYLDN